MILIAVSWKKLTSLTTKYRPYIKENKRKSIREIMGNALNVLSFDLIYFL
jgi:hypothetical protein